MSITTATDDSLAGAVTSVYAELGLVALAAMFSPTTLSFSVLALVLGERPRRTGFWFFLGAFLATLLVGVIGAFAIGDLASAKQGSSTPPTWVSWLDIALAVLIVAYVAYRSRRPADPRRAAGMIAQMERVASSPAIAIVGAGAALANPGGFIPVALKDISQLHPSAGEYLLLWLLFTVIALLPLLVALVLLAVAPRPTTRLLQRLRTWLERHVRTLAFAIVLLLAAALLRNGIAGLTG